MTTNEPIKFTLKAPRGRQQGYKPKPQPSTIAEFVSDALANPPTPPAERVVPRTRTGGVRSNGIWSSLKTAEERSEYARWLASLRKPENMARTFTGGARRTAKGWDFSSQNAAIAKAELEAGKLLKKLIKAGTISAEDKGTIEATRKALVSLKSPGGSQKAKGRLAARLLATFHPDEAKTEGGR